MPDLTVSSAIDNFMQSADQEEMLAAVGAAATITDTALSGSGPYALTLLPNLGSRYTVTITGDRTFTASSDTGHRQARVEVTVAGGPHTITFPTAYRNGATSTSTTVSVPNGNHIFILRTPDGGSTYYWEDTVFSASDVPAAASATNYTPSAATVAGHLGGIDTALASAGGSNIIHQTAASATVINNSTTPTAVYTAPIPGNTLGADKWVRVQLHGTVVATGANPLTLSISFGGTTMVTAASGNLTNNATARVWSLDVSLAADGATNAQRLIVHSFGIGGVSNASVGYGNLGSPIIFGPAELGGTAAVDSTSSRDLVVTLTPGGNMTVVLHKGITRKFAY